MHITTAGIFHHDTAWRGVYLVGKDGATKFAIIFDPNIGNYCGPTLHIVLGYRKDCTGGRKGSKSIIYRLPHLRWKYPAGRLYKFAYGIQSRFLHGMDARYGWGSKKRR